MYSWRGAQGRQRSKDSELQEGIPEGITEGVTFNACPRGDWENGQVGRVTQAGGAALQRCEV